MNVLYITKTSPFSGGGGGEKRAREVTKRLAERGHDITIFCGKTDPDLPKHMERDGCTVRHVTCIPDQAHRFSTVAFYSARYLFPVVSIPILASFLFTRSIDVVLENMTPYPTPAVVLAKVFGTPIVAVQHEFFDWSIYSTYGPLSATIQLIVQNFLRIFDYDTIIVPTSHVKSRFVEYGVDGSRIEVVPNGVNWRRFHLPEVESHHANLVTVGRLSKRKGQSDVLGAVERLHREHGDVTLDVIGAGPARSRLENLTTQLDISDQVTFHGYVSDEKKIELLNRAEIFVFASRQEGFGLVLLEAMSAGLPVVARELPVYHEFFTHEQNGFLVEEPVKDNLASKISGLIDSNNKRSEIGKVNRDTASRFDWERTATETNEILEELVRVNQRPNSKSS